MTCLLVHDKLNCKVGKLLTDLIMDVTDADYYGSLLGPFCLRSKVYCIMSYV